MICLLGFYNCPCNLLPVVQKYLPLREHCDGVGVPIYLEIELHFCVVNHEVKNR